MDYADRLSWRIVLENIVETLSIYIWPIFFSTHYQRVHTLNTNSKAAAQINELQLHILGCKAVTCFYRIRKFKYL